MKFKMQSPVILSALIGMTLSSISLAQSGVLEEVVVTASKRATTLQAIPIAVSVTSADVIEKAEIQDLSDLQSVVPSLRVNTLQNSSNTNFEIRGFGNGANNPGIEPSVGVFIDGVYRSRSAAAISDLPNIERVEVLRGPQSTLFGKNASAGVISVVTKEPTGETGGRVSATLGNYSQLTLKGQYEGAISDTVAFDISASSNTRDGYVDNLVTGNDINNRNRQAIRGQLVFRPNDETKVRLIADFDKIDEECCGVVNLEQSRTELFVNSVTNAKLLASDPEALSGYFNVDPTNQVDNAGVSLQIDHDYDGFSVTSITSFRNVDSYSNIDADFTSAANVTNPVDTQIDTFTQEIRLTSDGDNVVDWMVGGFYFDESIDYTSTLEYGSGFRPFADALTLAAGAPNALAGIEQALGLPVFNTFFANGSAVHENTTLDNQAISIFGQFDWHISDQLMATVGLNYTKDEKEASVKQTQRDAFSSLNLDLLGLQALKSLQFLPPFQDLPNKFENGETDDDELTYTLRLAYDLNDNINLYGGISTGFKATSWNLSRDARPTAATISSLRSAGLAVNNLTAGTRYADPEEATVFELGLKARFSSGAFNMAVFDQEIKGFQSNVFGGTGFNLSNAGKQSTQGVEFDLVYYPVEALQFTLAGTFLDPKYDSFVGGLGISGPEDLSGKTPSGIHKTSISTAMTYNFSVADNLDAYVRGGFQYEDKVPTNDNVPAAISSRETKNLNLSAGVSTDSGLAFSLWARNVTDHATVTTGFPTVAGTGGFFGYRNQPCTYGMTLSKKF